MNTFENAICNNDIEGVLNILQDPLFDLDSQSNFALTVCLRREYYNLIEILVNDKRLRGDANHNNAFNSTITLERYNISLLLLKNKQIYDYVTKNNPEIYNKLMSFKLNNNISNF